MTTKAPPAAGFTFRETQKILNRSRASLCRDIEAGLLTKVKAGSRRVLIPRQSLITYLERVGLTLPPGL